MMLFQELEDVLGQGAIDRFLAGLLAIAEWAPDPEETPVLSTRDPDDDYLLGLRVSVAVARRGGVLGLEARCVLTLVPWRLCGTVQVARPSQHMSIMAEMSAMLMGVNCF
jgi:hypothetical protein